MFDFQFNALRSLLGWRIKSQDAPPGTTAQDSYLEKLLKYIPADINAGYVALSGILTQAATTIPWWLNWAVFGALLVLTPFYVCYLKTDPPGLTSNKCFHWMTACLAFTAWVFALGSAGPFGSLVWYQPAYGSIILVLVTLTIPVLERFFVKTPPPSGGGTNGNASAAPGAGTGTGSGTPGP